MSFSPKRKKALAYASSVLVIVLLVSAGLLVRQRFSKTYEQEYKELKTRYVDLVNSQINLYEVLMAREQDKPQQYIAQYKDLSQEAFGDQIRKQIVELQMSAESLREPQNKPFKQDYASLVSTYTALATAQINILRSLLDNRFDLRPHFGSYRNFFKKDYVKDEARDLSKNPVEKFLEQYGRDDFEVKRQDEAFIEDLKRRVVELEFELKKISL